MVVIICIFTFSEYYCLKLVRNLNKIRKYIIGEKNFNDCQNEPIIFVKRKNLTNTFKPSLEMLRTLSNKVKNLLLSSHE